MSATKIPFVRTASGINMCLNGRPYNIAREDKLYPDIVAALKDEKTVDEILDIINTEVNVFKNATKLTDTVTIADGIVYFNNEPLHMSLADRMVQMLAEGFDLVPMARFLENLMANPSRTAVQELYSFLEKGNMPITPDGHFMAYKAVRADFKDIHSGTFDNSIGCICEMPRNQVDDNRDRTCSSGLHFCSFEYLPHFANANGHVMLVKINPADVVSIPADYNDTKGRCSRYEVVAEYEGYYKEFGPAFTTMLYDPENPEVNQGNNHSDYGYDEDPVEEYRLFGDGDEIDSFDDLCDAKDAAIEEMDNYDEVIVLDSEDNEVFRIKNR